MFLSKRKNGIWYIHFTQQNGKKNRVSTKCRVKTEALKFLSDFQFQLKKREQSKVTPISLKDFSFEYRKNCELTLRPKTCKKLKTIFTRLEIYLGNQPLTSITSNHIKSFIREKGNKSAFTAQNYLAYLRSAFNKAVNDKYILENPCLHISNFKLPEKQPLFFSPEDFQVFLNVVDKEYLKDLFILAVQTGLRQMELITLKWNQVSFKDGLLILDNQSNITKSKRVRSLPLSISALQILSDRKLKSDSEFDFVFSLDNKIMTQDRISKVFKSYVIKSNLNPKLKFHSLRHTFASWLVQRGVNIYEVSKLLGHSDIKVTEIYSHLKPENLKSAVDLLTDIGSHSNN
jgi:integrase